MFIFQTSHSSKFTKRIVVTLSHKLIYYIYLYTDDIGEAYNLIKDLEPTTPQEYILKGVVNAALGQEQGSVSKQFISISNQTLVPSPDYIFTVGKKSPF